MLELYGCRAACLREAIPTTGSRAACASALVSYALRMEGVPRAIDKEIPMPTYISLLKFTEAGIQKIKDSPARLDRARAAISAAGGEMKGFYLTLGHYDAVAISEAPSDDAYASTILAIGAAGAVRTETLRAFTEEEYRRIISTMP
jgi:uncharacterized protein with GYD domain